MFTIFFFLFFFVSCTDSPRNTSLTVRYTSELLDGGSVTLTCSSDASPPVQSYTWYRRNQFETSYVGAGKTVTFTSVLGNGQYFCEAWNGVGSQNSTAVVIIFAGWLVKWIRSIVGHVRGK